MVNERIVSRVSGGRKELTLWGCALLVPAALMIVAWVAVEIWRQTRLRGVPDIGHPFNVAVLGRIDVNPADNARADYRTAAGNMTQLPADETDDHADWLELNRPAAEQWKRGTEKPVFLRSQPVDLSLDNQSNSFSEMRAITDWVRLETERLESEHNYDSAWEWLRGLFRYSRHLGMFDSELERIYGALAHDHATNLTMRWSRHDQLNAEQLQRALEELRLIDCMTAAPSATIRAEYFIKMDKLHRLDELRSVHETLRPHLSAYVDDFGIASERFPGRLELHMAHEPELTRRLLQHQVANLLAYCDLPRERRPPLLDGHLLYFDAGDSGQQGFLSGKAFQQAASRSRLPQFMLFKNHGEPGAFLRERARQGLVELALAVEWFRREHGEFPETVEDLISAGIIDKVPDDPMSRSPSSLNYQRDPWPPLCAMVWCAGQNGVNNGGVLDAQRGAPPDMGYRIGVCEEP